jgi:hypothetical protein
VNNGSRLRPMGKATDCFGRIAYSHEDHTAHAFHFPSVSPLATTSASPPVATKSHRWVSY